MQLRVARLRGGLLAVLAASAGVGAGAVAVAHDRPARPSLDARAGPARIQGTYVLSGTVTASTDPRGVQRHAQLSRTWHITPARCGTGACGQLSLTGRLGSGAIVTMTLRRGAGGTYFGRRVTSQAEHCGARRIPAGVISHAQVRDLTVTRYRKVNGVTDAFEIHADTVSDIRISARVPARCRRRVSRVQAAFSGRLVSAAPAPNTDTDTTTTLSGTATETTPSTVTATSSTTTPTVTTTTRPTTIPTETNPHPPIGPIPPSTS